MSDNLLRHYQYAVYPSAIPMTVTEARQVRHLSENDPLVDVTIDFQLQEFILHGDWNFITAANPHAEPDWFNCHKERIQVNAVISPGQVIDLADTKNDGWMFALDGSLKDGDCTSHCSGLLVVETVEQAEAEGMKEWSITFYIYDAANESSEIMLKVPVYIMDAPAVN